MATVTDKCPHEGDIDYGKSMLVTPTLQVVHMLCKDCNSVGTILEQLDDHTEHWDQVSEIWHEPSDYYNNTLASQMIIELHYK